MAEVGLVGNPGGLGGYRTANARFSDYDASGENALRLDFVLIEPSGNRRHVTMRRADANSKWERAHRAPIRGFWGETGARAARGGSVGAAGYLGFPMYAGQWFGEKALEWGGQAAMSGADMANVAGPYPGSHYGMLGTEEQHDKARRQAISGGLLSMPPAPTPQGMHQFHPESVAQIMQKAYRDTNPGFEPGRTAPIPNTSGLRSMDPMLENVKGALDELGLPAGSMSGHSRTDARLFGGVEGGAEMVGAFAGHGVGRKLAQGANRLATRAGAQAGGQAFHPHSKEYVEHQARRIAEDIIAGRKETGGGVVGKAVKGGLKRLTRIGFPSAVIVPGMLISDKKDDGTLKSKEELIAEARVWALMTEFGRTGFLMAGAHMQPMNRLAQASVNWWKRLAAKGNKKALEMLTKVESVSDLEKLVRSRVGDKAWNDYVDVARTAHNLGLHLPPIANMGKTGALFSRALLASWAAKTQKPLAEAIAESTRQIQRKIDQFQRRLVSKEQRAKFPGSAVSPHPGTGRMTESWEGLAKAIDTSHRAKMKVWDEKYDSFLRDKSMKTPVPHEGLKAWGPANVMRRETDSEFDQVPRALFEIAGRVKEKERYAFEQAARALVAEGKAKNLTAAYKKVKPEDLEVLSARDLVGMIRNIRASMRQTAPGAHAERSQLSHAVKQLQGMLNDADPKLAARMKALDAEYDREIGQVYRSDFFKGRNMAENVSGSTRVGGVELHQAMMSDDLTVNRVVMEDLLATGHTKEIGDAIVNTALTRIVGQSGDLDMRLLSNFIQKNQEALNAGTKMGLQVKTRLYEALEPQLRRSLGMRMVGFGKREKKTVSYGKGAKTRVREEVIEDIPPDQKVIDAAINDRNVMRVLMEAVDQGMMTDAARQAGRAAGKPFRGAAEGRRMLQWAATHRLTQSSTPYQDIDKNIRSYELLFEDNPEALRTVRDLAKVKESVAHMENIEELTLRSKHSITTGVGTAYSSFKGFVMANIGTSLGTIMSNLKLIMDARVRGPYFATGQAVEMAIGLTEVQRVLDLLLDVAGTAPKGTFIARRMMERKLEAHELTGRFGKLAANYFRPFFYEYEQSGRIRSDEEKDTEAQSVYTQRLTQ